MWTVSGEGGEGVDCEWGTRRCGLGVGKEGRVWTVSGEGGEGLDCEWGTRRCGLGVGKEGRCGL